MESEKNETKESDRLEELRGGDFVDTPGADISKQPIPSWYDAKKFNRAKEVYRDYFASVNFSHLCGLLLSFYFTKNIKTLRSTGESETKTTLFHRYLATIRHIQKWYEGDVWDPKDPAHRSLGTVRYMHGRVGKKMAALNDGVVYVSQWDMAVTQWAFVGPMVLFRSRMGLHGLSDEDYEALIHFWRTVGYLLGIKDEYNLCHGDPSQVLTACDVMLKKEYKVRMAIADSSSVSMAKNVVAALSMIDNLLTWPSIATYIHELVDLPCPEVMSFVDRICHNLMRFVMLHVIQYKRMRLMLNDLFRWRLNMSDKKDRELMKKAKLSIPATTVTAG